MYGEQLKIDFRTTKGTVKDNRRKAWDGIHPKENERRKLVLDILGDNEMTVSEMVEELLKQGKIAYFNRNYVAPRVTELKDMGVICAAGSRMGTRSNRMETVWKRAEVI